jgi:hypothetical protein
MTIVPIGTSEAIAFVASHHRHNKPPAGAKFAIGCSDGEKLVGVVIVGRPVARMFDDGLTAEVTRCCVLPDSRNACSMLYQAAWRAAKAMGYHKLITYTLQSESGSSLRGAGWEVVAERKANNPGGWQNRPGREWQAVVGQAKLLWEARPAASQARASH